MDVEDRRHPDGDDENGVLMMPSNDGLGESGVHRNEASVDRQSTRGSNQ